ncbi:MAG: DUF4358 domain-containing protein [Oscillospiraceae bacterium]
MKKTLTAILALTLCLTLTACDEGTNSGSSQSSNSSSVSETKATPAEKTASLLNEVSFPEMRKLETADDLIAILGIKVEDLTDYAAYICPSGMAPDEFGVFVAKDEVTAASIKTTIENRIKYQSDTFRDYPLAEKEVYKLDDAFVELEGNVVYYAICADNNKARDILG